MAILQLQDVTKQYPGPEGQPGPKVLDKLNWQVEPGQAVAVTGPSGSGKTTLLNIIGALDNPTAGRVTLDGEDLSNHDEKQLAEIRNRKIGFIFQLHHLLPQCTVLENVLVPTLPGGRDMRSGAADRGRELLDRVGLAEFVDKKPGQLSGGQMQRVAVVRALINQPALLLADEPTGSLDRSSSDNLTELLLELNAERQLTLVVVTHAEHLAERMQERFDLLDGKLTERTASA
ncbi:MAG: ABC transporter ATP-binding protein [Phycisphaerae bacterium]